MNDKKSRQPPQSSGLGKMVQRKKPAATWEHLPASPNTVNELKHACSQFAPGKNHRILLTGPGSESKTQAAEAIATQLNLDFYRIDLSAVVSKYIGETEKNLRRLFDAAEDGGVVLFFDEADALFGKRSEVKDSHDRYANIEINYLLQRLEEFNGLAILATNTQQNLDSALLRHFGYIIDIP